MRQINEIIVHCSATREAWMDNRPTSEKVAEIRRWHVDGNGWRDIGYHYIIDRDGTVAEGRPLETVGAHCKGHNTGTIGVCLIGGHGSNENDLPDDNFTPEQMDILRVHIGAMKVRFPTITKVSGHNQYAAKACPGFNVPAWYGSKVKRTSPAQSTTIQATAATAVAGAGGVATAVGKLEGSAQMLLIGFACVSALGLAWIARERLKRWARGDR